MLDKKFNETITKILEAANPKDAEKTIIIKCNGDFNWPKFLEHLRYLGSIGSSRTITAKDSDDKDVPFGWDGDGSDKILSVEINGEKII